MENDILNTRITDLELAKKYFYAMGCSHFHMSRENLERYDEYKALNIPEELEHRWRRERIECAISAFPYGDIEAEWLHFGSLAKHVYSERNYLEKVVDIAERIIDDMPNDKKHLILVEITGNSGSATHGGLIELAHIMKRNELVKRLSDICIKAFKQCKYQNDTMGFTRGYFIDIAKNLHLDVDKIFLVTLRKKHEEVLYLYHENGASKGNTFSMYQLGMCHLKGTGCKKDKKAAKHWLEKAAERGQSSAINELNHLW